MSYKRVMGEDKLHTFAEQYENDPPCWGGTKPD